MNNRITLKQVVARLAENDEPCEILELQNGAAVLVSRRGGRIFGPFFGEEGESILWCHANFADAAAFHGFVNAEGGLAAGNWNLGGDRMWIAPEIEYNVKDRTDFWNSYALPEQVDPGQYVLESGGKSECRLNMDVCLDTYKTRAGRKELHVERIIRKADDPLRHLRDYASLIRGTSFAGTEQVFTLTEKESDAVLSEVWSLLQLNPGGELLIPAVPCLEYTDYYEPIDKSLFARHASHCRLKITGQRRYKVGFKAAHLSGRIGYYNRMADGQPCLLIRSFFNNPSAIYAEEPDSIPDCRGHSVHIYNDSGDFGAFGELECNGQTIGGPTGRTSSTDSMLLWVYVGPANRLSQIAKHLLGVENI